MVIRIKHCNCKASAEYYLIYAKPIYVIFNVLFGYCTGLITIYFRI